tara:strand:+ start:214 stop:567 length:354 start_codon:yes stop_codon:yes gene_type:complete
MRATRRKLAMMAQRVRREGAERSPVGTWGGVVREVCWPVPEGFTQDLQRSHESLQYSMAAWSIALTTCAGSCLAGRWARPLAWSPTPRLVCRLVKKFNYRIVWADGSKGPAKLQVDN